MIRNSFDRPAAAGVLAAALLAAPLGAAPAAAADMKTAERMTETVTVVAVDHQTRRLTVKTAAGETESMKAPTEFRNFDTLKPGDKIKATYTMEAAFTLSPPDKPLPKDKQTMVAGRTPKGELPGGAIGNHMVVTGAVVAVNKTGHTVKLVSPNGGEVHTIFVSSPEGRQLLAKVKPGDKITAEITESLLISTQRD